MPVKTKKSKLKYIIENKALYFFLLPGILYIIVFKIIPMTGILFAFTEINTFDIFKSEWVGLKNFQMLFSGTEFYNVLKNSVTLSLMSLIFGFPAPIILALFINEVKLKRYKRITQTIMYLPHFISWVVIAGLVMNFLSPTGGIFNKIITMMGKEPVYFLQEAAYFRPIIILSQIWKETGWGTVIYLAAISSIDSEIYEAATVDGAGRLLQMIKITLPSIVSTIVVMLILRCGHILSNGFEQVFLLSNTLNQSVSQVFETYTYEIGIRSGRFSYATAVGMFQSIVGLLLVLLTNFLSRKFNEQSIW